MSIYVNDNLGRKPKTKYKGNSFCCSKLNNVLVLFVLIKKTKKKKNRLVLFQSVEKSWFFFKMDFLTTLGVCK